MQLKVGLTGGIGSGKTTVAKIFELLGVPVYYADEAAKRLYHTDTQLMQEMKRMFGDDVYRGNELDRAKLAGLVFSDPAKLQALNNLVHPLTEKDAAAWMQRQTAPYVLKEAALLFESGSVAGLDLVVGVFAPQHLRLQRAMQRDGATREAVLNRMDRQLAETLKMRLCDEVIRNNEQELLIPQVMALDRKLRTLAAEQRG